MTTVKQRSMRAGLSWCGVGAVVLGAVAWFLILPLQRRVQEDEQRATSAVHALAVARRDIQLVRELEPAAAEARGKLNALLSNLGDDPAANVATMMQDHFRQAGFTASVEDLKTAKDEPGLSGYVRRLYRVQIQIGENAEKVAVALDAAGGLEARTPLLRVRSFALQTAADAPLRREATVEVSVLTRR